MRKIVARVRTKAFRTLHSLAAKGFGPAHYLLRQKGKEIFDIGVIFAQTPFKALTSLPIQYSAICSSALA